MHNSPTGTSQTHCSQWVSPQLLLFYKQILNDRCVTLSKAPTDCGSMLVIYVLRSVSWSRFHSCILVLDVTTILSPFLGKPQMDPVFEHRPWQMPPPHEHVLVYSPIQPFALHSPRGQDILQQKRTWKNEKKQRVGSRSNRGGSQWLMLHRWDFVTEKPSRCHTPTITSYSKYICQHAVTWLPGLCGQLHWTMPAS